ncbi:hypothetical protein SDC9_182148 [bioreactor metagenome]|uniref:Uncharacterized protein n=1 Tax=bioreactor metagenome TaxID=1076179 RepID=A0A645HEX4_9ZZZZ
MNLNLTEFLSERIDEIISQLKETNTAFALSDKRSSQLIDDIDPIMMNEKRDMTITPKDCMNISEFFEQELVQEGITQEKLYKQGYLDCVKLLRMLEVIR